MSSQVKYTCSVFNNTQCKAFVRLELGVHFATIQAIKCKYTVCIKIKLDILIYTTLYKELGDNIVTFYD